MIKNGDFSNRNWRDVQAPGLFLINQEPAHWQLSWLAPGTPLYDDPNTQATGVPECVHKLHTQLPPNEQLGAKDALILAGDKTYKIFSATAPFGAELKQTVTGLQPGDEAEIVAPVQVHMHGETDHYGAESSLWVNGEGGWANGGIMGDRDWYYHKVKVTVPEDGKLEIVIRVKSKWARPKDFFIDDVRLTGVQVADNAPPPDEGEPIADPIPAPTAQTVIVQVPPGLQVKQVAGEAGNTIEIKTPPHVRLEIV